MTPKSQQSASDDARIQAWLDDLRHGTEPEKIGARRGLARVFEQRGMLQEATDLLMTNVRTGERDANTYRWLAHLYRQQGLEMLALEAAAEAAKLARPADPGMGTIVASPSPAPLPPAPPQYTTRSRGPTGTALLVGIIVILGSLWGLSALLGYGSSEPVSRAVTPTATPAPSRSGKAEANLGRRPFDFGSNNQARELLKLMDEQPGRAEYQISYETTEDAVVVGFNLNTQVLGRVHVYRNGRGYKESWRGYVLERVRAAANGGSLNDTPAGKSFVQRENF